MKNMNLTPDGKFEILNLRFKDFETLPKSLLIYRDEEWVIELED